MKINSGYALLVVLLCYPLLVCSVEDDPVYARINKLINMCLEFGRIVGVQIARQYELYGFSVAADLHGGDFQ